MNAYELARARKLLNEYGFTVTGGDCPKIVYTVHDAKGKLQARVLHYDAAWSKGLTYHAQLCDSDGPFGFLHRFEPVACLAFIAAQLTGTPEPDYIWRNGI